MHARVSLLCVVTLLASACAGASGSPDGSVTYTTSLAEPGLNGSFTPASAVVLFDAQFLDPFSNEQLVVASISPSPPGTTQVSWTSSDASVVVRPQQPDFASLAPTAPPLGTFAVTGTAYGAATITANVGAPVNQRVSIPAYHYPSLSLGCAFRYRPAFSFDPGAAATDTTSDLYDTKASDSLGPLDGCANTPFATAPGTPELWHAPYGGVLIPNVLLAQFPSIQPSQWQNTGTQFTPQDGVLLFKTKAGRIVKAMLPIGPFEVSGTDGTFPY